MRALGIPEVDRSGLVTAVPGTPLAEAFQQLARQRVNSALVWGAATSAWVGFLDLSDYVRHLGASSASPLTHSACQPMLARRPLWHTLASASLFWN